MTSLSVEIALPEGFRVTVSLKSSSVLTVWVSGDSEIVAADGAWLVILVGDLKSMRKENTAMAVTAKEPRRNNLFLFIRADT